MSQRRAAPGGEYGENGEWYAGGKWIANTDRPKRHAQKRGPRTEQIEPWRRVPYTGRMPIMRRYDAVFFWQDGTPTAIKEAVCDYYGKDPARAERARLAYIDGARYLDEIPGEPEETKTNES